MQELIELVRSGAGIDERAMQIPIWLFETVRLIADSRDFGGN